MNGLDEARRVIGCVPPGERVMVGLSGGKDSIVTLDLCARQLGAENVECYFMQLVPGLRVELDPIENLLCRYPGVKLRLMPHFELARFMRYSVFRPYVDGAEKTPLIKQRDIEHALSKRTGILWFAGGQRCAESVVRNAWLKSLAHKTGSGIAGVDARHHRIFPIALWKTPSVFAYLRHRKLPIPKAIGPVRKGASGGINLHPRTLDWLERMHPKDFAKLCEIFPYAPAAALKWRLFGDAGVVEKKKKKKPKKDA